MANGAVALFGSLGATDPRLADYEWTGAILHGEPYGTAMKRSYDAALLAHAAGHPTFPRLVPGQPVPEGLFGAVPAATRILLGDPILRPHRRDNAIAVGVQESFENVAPDGRKILTVRYRVEHPECAEYFSDPFSAEQRLHLRIPLPRGAKEPKANLRSSLVNAKAVYAVITAQAPETWRGRDSLHVLLRGKTLARPGLVLTVDVTYR